LYRDLLFVAHVHRCSVFNLNGEYLYDIGKHGQGPGEFVASPLALFFLDDYMGIFDFIENKMLYYTIDGRFVYDYFLRPGVESIKRVGKDILAGSVPISSDNQDIRMLFFDTKGNIINSIRHKNFPKPGDDTPYGINVGSLFTYNNETYFKETYNDTVFRISKDLKLMPQYLITTGKYSVNYDERILNIEKYRKGKCPFVSFENYRYILSRTGEQFIYYLIDKKTDRIEKVLLTYNEEMDELFDDDYKMMGGGKLYEPPRFERVPTCFTVKGVSEDGKIILSHEFPQNSDDNPVIVMVRIKE
jgi:hypothetical protein